MDAKDEGAFEAASQATTPPAKELVKDAAAESDRNPVFTSLVREDGDIVGLVAYSIYKQNKLDWLLAFQNQRGRAPTEAEQIAYIIGEGTPRRLAIYRHLADATLAGSGPDNLTEAGTGEAARRAYFRPKDEKPMKGLGWFGISLLAYAALTIALLLGIWLATRYGVVGRT
jgi:hypothetical protein